MNIISTFNNKDLERERIMGVGSKMLPPLCDYRSAGGCRMTRI